jgi:hypothetical protein
VPDWGIEQVTEPDCRQQLDDPSLRAQMLPGDHEGPTYILALEAPPSVGEIGRRQREAG